MPPGDGGVRRRQGREALIERYQFSTAGSLSACDLAAPDIRRLLTEALAKGVIPKRDVPAHAARQLLRVVGTPFSDVWGPVESANEEKAYSRYRGLLNDTAVSAANARNGRAIYQRTCGACHKLYGEGGTIGPDLTGSNRANLDYLLFNVLNPNGEIQDTYKMVVITTRDGRTFSGNVVSETPRQVTLGRAASRGENKSDISRAESTAWRDDTGLFETLADREVLFGGVPATWSR